MSRKGFLILLTIILLGVAFQSFTVAKLSLRVTGKWAFKIDANDLTGLAGSDFPGTFESSVTEIDLDVTKTAGDTSPWTLSVSRADVNWAPNVLVYLRRTTDGTGLGTIAGGTTYQLVTNTDTAFFTGTGDRTAIKIQLRLDFLAEDVNVDDYVTTVNYTVIE